jgi:ferredoxin
MAYKIDSTKCVACGACKAQCPVEAISESANGPYLEIDADKCVDCGGCAAACPCEAISAS